MDYRESSDDVPDNHKQAIVIAPQNLLDSLSTLQDGLSRVQRSSRLSEGTPKI